MGDRHYLTVPECAERIRSTPMYVYKLVRLKRIPVCRIGRKVLFATDQIDEWVRASAPKPEPVSLSKFQEVRSRHQSRSLTTEVTPIVQPKSGKDARHGNR